MSENHDRVILLDKNLSWEEIEQLSYEEVTRLLHEAQRIEEKIGQEIREAKGDYADHGKRSDWGWIKRAERAKKAHGYIRRRLSELRRSKHPAYMEAVRFKKIAKQVLTEETYHQILTLATEEQSGVR